MTGEFREPGAAAPLRGVVRFLTFTPDQPMGVAKFNGRKYNHAAAEGHESHVPKRPLHPPKKEP